MDSDFDRDLLGESGGIDRTTTVAWSIRYPGFRSVVNQRCADPRSLGFRKVWFADIQLVSRQRNAARGKRVTAHIAEIMEKDMDFVPEVRFLANR